MAGEIDQLTLRPLSGLVGFDKSGLVGRMPYRERIAIGIIGQSNEQGRVQVADLAAYGQAFASLRNPTKRGLVRGQIYVPPNGTSNGGNLKQFTPYGGMWWKAYDDLYDWGYDAVFVNGAIGSMSMISHAAGAISPWAAHSAFNAKRAPLGSGTPEASDAGYRGDLLIKNGNLFRCTTGRQSYAFHDGLFNIPGQTTGKADNIFSVGAQLSGATEPDWTTVSVGGTIADGDLVWTCEEANTYGFPDGSVTNGTRIMTQLAFGQHWDPYGIIERLFRMMQTVCIDRRYIIIENGQSDVSAQSADYQRALQNIAKFFADRGYVVLIGLSSFTVGGNTTNWNTLQTARAAALTTFNGGSGVQADGALVQPGANLYASIGTASIASLTDAGGVHLNGAGAILAGGYWADAFKAFLPQRA